MNPIKKLENIKKIKLDFVDLIVLGSYYVFSLLLFLSSAGLFRKELIIFGLAAGFLLLLVWGRIEFKKSYLYFFVLIPILFSGILLVKGSFGGDAIHYWLLLAKEIVLQERMPDFLFNTVNWFTSREPLMPLFYAGMFSLFGFSNWVIAVLPFFFAAAAVFLMYRWLLEKGVSKNYVIFGVLLLLANPIFLDNAAEIRQESFILFFFAASFYYFEKFQKTNNRFYFLLIFLSVILAAASKMTGLILFLPLGWLLIKNLKNPQLKKPYFYLFLTFPVLLWLLRNYIIYDNPLFSYFNGIFKGRYYDLTLTVNQFARNLYYPSYNIFTRLAQAPINLFLLLFPFGIMSFYGFWKERKVQYILLFFIFFLLVFAATIPSLDYVRYSMPFLMVFLVYAITGLEKINSKIFLSFIFFLNLWGLFFTKLSFSESQFLSPIEARLGALGSVSQFIYDYGFLLALILSVFFFFLISSRRQSAKYLILLLISAYLVKTNSFHLGSWLNVWLPILALIFIILLWRFLIRLKGERLFKAIIGCLMVLLVLNSWGLAFVYFAAHGQFVFPNFAEAYDAQPEAAAAIEKIEGKNKDFYIFASAASYFPWYHDFKIVVPFGYTFHVITNLEYKDSLNPSEIHSLFKRSNIKYIINNHSDRPQLGPFFDKIKSRPDLFEQIFQKEWLYVWRIKT